MVMPTRAPRRTGGRRFHTEHEEDQDEGTHT